MTDIRHRGRPRKYDKYEQILSLYPARSMTKRPVYVDGIGIFRGKSGDTVFVKIFLRHRNAFAGRNYAAGSHLEIKLGNLSSWDWASLEAKKSELQSKSDRGLPLEETQPLTFEQYAQEWLKIAQGRQKSFLTSKYTVEANLNPTLGKKLLLDINVRDINLWQNERLKLVKPATVQREKGMLKAILNSALKEGLLEKNPVTQTNRIKGIEARLRYWTPDEIKQVLKSAYDIEYEFGEYISWALHSAMRRSEILRMEWKDILKITDGNIKVFIPTSKTDKPRQIPCNKQMYSILERLSKLAKNEKVFSFTDQMLKRRVEKLRALSGVKDIRLHDLRRTNITMSLLAGIDPKTLTGITGHKDLQMIQKHYSVVVDSALNQASERSGHYIESLISS